MLRSLAGPAGVALAVLLILWLEHLVLRRAHPLASIEDSSAGAHDAAARDLVDAPEVPAAAAEARVHASALPDYRRRAAPESTEIV